MSRPVLPLAPADPPGLRRAGPGDAPALAALLAAAFPEGDWTAEAARRELLDEPSVEAVLVIEEGGRLLATASARRHPGFPGEGYVHFVGTHPDARGRGLGVAVTGAVLRRFAESGLDRAVLETDDHRLPAIAAYLGMGFVPLLPEPDHEARWSAVLRDLAARRRAPGAGS